MVDYWFLIGKSATDFDTIIQKDAGPDVRAHYRHLIHRGEKGSAMLKLRSEILFLFREHFHSK